MATDLIDSLSKKLELLCAKNGPTPEEYQSLNNEVLKIYHAIQEGVFDVNAVMAVLDLCGDVFSTETMQGMVLRKPHGYAGDFEMIDKIYLEYKTHHPHLARWDDFFHSQEAVKAVKNRKTYFHYLLNKLDDSARVLKLGCGPGRSMFEWLNENPDNSIQFECIDVDKNAIEYASTLNNKHKSKIIFHHVNVFKFKVPAETKYDLIWAAGLFDYFDDKVFESLAKRFYKSVKPSGELVIGNFSTNNPTRACMEVLGQWFLNHRSPEQLLTLGRKIAANNKVRVEMEPTGINLFLHIS